jgi:hypothetical protein
MYAILNADKIKPHQADVVTARNGEDALENGAFVALGELENTGLGRDTYMIGKLAADTVQWGMVDCVALMYDETKDERDFILGAGEIARVRRFPAGGAMTIAKKHIAEEVVAGNLLGLKEGTYQLAKVETKAEAVARVLEVCDFNGQPSYYIEFI